MKKIVIMILTLFFAMTISAQHFHTFENNEMKAVFNLENGSLDQLQNKTTNWNIIPSGSGISFEMELQDDQGNKLFVDGLKQDKPIYKEYQDSLVFIWNGIKCEHSNTKIDVQFKGVINFTSNEGLIFTGQIINKSSSIVAKLHWPNIGSVSIPDPNGKLLMRDNSYTSLRSREIYPNNGFTQLDSRLPELAFVLLENQKQGLYISSKDTAFNEFIQVICTALPTDTFTASLGSAEAKKNNADRLSLGYKLIASRNIYTYPGTITDLVPVVVKPYEGTWEYGVDIYKAWRATWYKPPYRAEWIKQVNAWQQIQINSAETNVNFRFKDLVSYAKEAKKYGVNAIQLTGWTLGGQDRSLPVHDIDPHLGTKDEFKKAIAECQAMGVNIILFTKFIWVEYTSPEYDKFKKYIAWEEDGTPRVRGGYSYDTYTQLMRFNNRPLCVLCMADDSLRLLLRNEFKKCLELGAAGMVFDENQNHGSMFECFNPNHNHKVPAFIHQGANILDKEFYEMTEKYSPGFLMAGEGPYDEEALYYATYTRADLYHDAGQRYIDPDLPIICTVMDHGDFNKVNMCLKDRYSISYEPSSMHGHLSDFPRIMAYGMKVDSLRRRYSDYLWTAEYRGTVGAKVEGKNLLYSVFKRKSDGKRAIVIMNCNLTENSIVNLDLNDSSNSLTMVSPENQEERPFINHIQIAPQGAIVVLEK